jgi:hypothetical protein
LAQRLSGDVLAAMGRESIAQVQGRPPMRLLQAPYEQLAPLRDDSRIRLAAANLLRLERRHDQVEFQAYGNTHRVPALVAPALALLSESDPKSITELLAVLDHAEAASHLLPILAKLAKAGVVLVESPPG